VVNTTQRPELFDTRTDWYIFTLGVILGFVAEAIYATTIPGARPPIGWAIVIGVWLIVTTAGLIIVRLPRRRSN
jgi:hypothetical protein